MILNRQIQSIFLFSLLIIFALNIPIIPQAAPIRVACVGTSITYGVGGSTGRSYPEQLGALFGSRYNVKNFGVSGSTILRKGDYPYWSQGTAFQDAKDFKPQILVLEFGTNDSKSQNWKYKSDFISDYMDMIKEFRRTNPRMQVFVCRCTPVFKSLAGITDSVVHDEVLPLIDSLSKLAGTSVIDYNTAFKGRSDLSADGVHPNDSGYGVMASVAKQAIDSSASGIIRYFSSSAASYEKGESVTLYWAATNGSQASINGTAVKEVDSMVVTPTGRTTYTLTTKGVVTDTMNLTVQYFAPGSIKAFKVDKPIVEIGTTDTCTFSWTAAKGSTVTLNGQTVELNGLKTVILTATTSYVLIAKGDVTDTSIVSVNFLESPFINRAFNRSVVVSSALKGFSAEAAIDGDTTTSWQSSSAASQWICIDMGKTYEINKVVINWGDPFATVYRLQALSEIRAIDNIYSKTNGVGGVDTIAGLASNGRYLRLLCQGKNDANYGYAIKEIEIYGKPAQINGVETSPAAPSGFKLESNYPNPFNPGTMIRYSIPKEGQVTVTIFDVLGREVSTLFNGKQNSGKHVIYFNASSISSGVYFCRVNYGAQSQVTKLVLLK